MPGSGSGRFEEPFVPLEPRFRSLLSRDAAGGVEWGWEVTWLPDSVSGLWKVEEDLLSNAGETTQNIMDGVILI